MAHIARASFITEFGDCCRTLKLAPHINWRQCLRGMPTKHAHGPVLRNLSKTSSGKRGQMSDVFGPSASWRQFSMSFYTRFVHVQHAMSLIGAGANLCARQTGWCFSSAK
jgi:hypothetical protein